MSKHVVENFLLYTAESIVAMEKITGKSVEYLEYDHHNATLKSGGDLKDEFRNKVVVKFHQPKPPQEPVPVSVVNASAAPETPLIDHVEKKRSKKKQTDV